MLSKSGLTLSNGHNFLTYCLVALVVLKQLVDHIRLKHIAKVGRQDESVMVKLVVQRFLRPTMIKVEVEPGKLGVNATGVAE